MIHMSKFFDLCTVSFGLYIVLQPSKQSFSRKQAIAFAVFKLKNLKC